MHETEVVYVQVIVLRSFCIDCVELYRKWAVRVRKSTNILVVKRKWLLSLQVGFQGR